jgi:hypothetical protein
MYIHIYIYTVSVRFQSRDIPVKQFILLYNIERPENDGLTVETCSPIRIYENIFEQNILYNYCLYNYCLYATVNGSPWHWRTIYCIHRHLTCYKYFGLLMACLWSADGLSMACRWPADGLPMACWWPADGLPMACRWPADGLPMACWWPA